MAYCCCFLFGEEKNLFGLTHADCAVTAETKSRNIQMQIKRNSKQNNNNINRNETKNPHFEHLLRRLDFVGWKLAFRVFVLEKITFISLPSPQFLNVFVLTPNRLQENYKMYLLPEHNSFSLQVAFQAITNVEKKRYVFVCILYSISVFVISARSLSLLHLILSIGFGFGRCARASTQEGDRHTSTLAFTSC